MHLSEGANISPSIEGPVVMYWWLDGTLSHSAEDNGRWLPPITWTFNSLFKQADLEWYECINEQSVLLLSRYNNSTEGLTHCWSPVNSNKRQSEEPACSFLRPLQVLRLWSLQLALNRKLHAHPQNSSLEGHVVTIRNKKRESKQSKGPFRNSERQAVHKCRISRQ